MKLHGNAALSWNGRRRLAQRVVVEGWTLTAAAKAAGVSVRCARPRIPSRSPGPGPRLQFASRHRSACRGRVDSLSNAHEDSPSEVGSKRSPASRPHEVKAPSFSSLILAAPGPSVMERAGHRPAAWAACPRTASAPPFEALRRSVAREAGGRDAGRLQPPADRTRLTRQTSQGSVRRNGR